MMEAEKQEAAKKDTARIGKPLTSIAGTGGTSRQQVLAGKKSKAQEKREGKKVAAPSMEESGDSNEEEQVPLKKVKLSKGKEVAS